MLRITEDKDQIIVREIPVAQWIISFVTINLLFFVICLQVTSEAERDSKILWISAMALGIAGVIFYVLVNSAITIRINKQSKILSLGKQSVFKNTFNVYSFNEIADLIYVNEIKGTRETIIYQLKLPLKDGRNINLSAAISNKEGQFFRAADLMNAYIFDSPDQIPFKLTVFNDN